MFLTKNNILDDLSVVVLQQKVLSNPQFCIDKKPRMLKFSPIKLAIISAFVAKNYYQSSTSDNPTSYFET